MSAYDTTPVDAAAAAVLSSNEVLLAAPNNAKLMEFYPTPAECSSTIAQAVNNSGQLFVRANSLTFGSSSNFQISSANILGCPVLNAEITIDAAVTTKTRLWAIDEDGWLFAMIRSIEVSYSNSNLSNLILDGVALRDWSLSQCRDEETRKSFLKKAGAGGLLKLKTTISKRLVASLPLSFLNWEGYSTKSGFPFDARTINGIIQIQINWRTGIDSMMTTVRCAANVSAGAAGGGNDALPPVTKFSDLRVSFRSYQLMDSAFSVGNALAADPEMRYTIPAKWLNTYRYQVDLTRGGAGSVSAPDGGVNGLLRGRIELTSAPAGMLQGIMLHIRPILVVNAAGATVDTGILGNDAVWASGANTINRQGSLRLDSVNLQYSGQNIIALKSQEEIDAYMRYCYGDDMKTRVRTIWGTRGASDGSNPKSHFAPSVLDGLINEATYYVDNVGVSEIATAKVPNSNANTDVEIEHQTYILPLMHNGCDVMRKRHFENLPQYSGSALTLEFDVLNKSTYYADRFPNTPGAIGAATTMAAGTLGGENTSSFRPLHYGPMWDGHTADVNGGIGVDYYYKRVEVSVTYIIAALVQNSGGMVELQI